MRSAFVQTSVACLMRIGVSATVRAARVYGKAVAMTIEALWA
jgi:hypothetical protein